MKDALRLSTECRRRYLTLKLPMVMPALPRDCIVESINFGQAMLDNIRLSLLSESFSPVEFLDPTPEYSVERDLPPLEWWARPLGKSSPAPWLCPDKESVIQTREPYIGLNGQVEP